MKIKVNKLNAYTMELSIILNWDECNTDFQQTVKKFSKKVRLPGFRPGKIPLKVLMNKFMANIEAEFIEEGVNKFYIEALRKENLVPVNKANIEDIDFQYEEHFRFKATFQIEPDIILPKMKKNCLKVQKTEYISDDVDIDNVINEMRKSRSEVKTVEDGAKEGHYLIVDLQKLDDSGLPIIGEKLEKRFLQIGIEPFIGDNMNKLIGLKAGAKTQIDLPDANNNSMAKYELSVINVEEQLIPEVNKDFIKLVEPEAKDEEDFRKIIKEKVDESYTQRSKEAYERILADSMIDYVKPEFAPAMVDSYLAHLIQETKEQQQSQYIDENKPWVLAKDPKQVNKVVEISTIALNLFRILIIYLKPVIPGIAERCELFLNEKNMNWSDKDKILAGSKINTYKNIIERIDKDQTDKLIEESKL